MGSFDCAPQAGRARQYLQAPVRPQTGCAVSACARLPPLASACRSLRLPRGRI